MARTCAALWSVLERSGATACTDCSASTISLKNEIVRASSWESSSPKVHCARELSQSQLAFIPGSVLAFPQPVPFFYASGVWAVPAFGVGLPLVPLWSWTCRQVGLFLVQDAAWQSCEMVFAEGDGWLDTGHQGLPRIHSFWKPSVSEANEGLVLQKHVKV